LLLVPLACVCRFEKKLRIALLFNEIAGTAAAADAVAAGWVADT
jgi:hypothetical protein